MLEGAAREYVDSRGSKDVRQIVEPDAALHAQCRIDAPALGENAALHRTQAARRALATAQCPPAPTEAALLLHDYLSAELRARIVKDAQMLNNALGYEMNTIEFAVQDGIPYAIDFLNPAPDFERDRITPFYFDMVVQRMADLVIDRALNGAPHHTWPRWAEMTGLGKATPV